MDMGPAGELSLIGGWLKLHYILNKGMAFGISFGSLYGKLFLTLFRLAVISLIIWSFIKLMKKAPPKGVLFAIALIIAGAIGNLLDSVFYGVLLDNAAYDSLTPWFHGQVIDMIYFDIWEGYLAEWIPFWGGMKIALLPIFNVADVSIFLGVLLLLINQKKIFKSGSSNNHLIHNTGA